MARSRFRQIAKWFGGALGVAGLLFGVGACEIATPFRGPGLSKDRTGDDANESVVVALTHAQLAWEGRGVFFDYSAKVIEDLPNQDGFLGYSLRRSIVGSEVWTATIWRDHESADAFVGAPEHRAAMREGTRAIDRGRFHRVEWPVNDLPPRWSDLKREIEKIELVDFAAKRERAK